MIFIALGANLPSQYGSPQETLEAAVAKLEAWPGMKVVARSSWYKTSPVGKVEQPDFINGVVQVTWETTPLELLRELLRIEEAFGRRRGDRWGPRLIDLDIIDFDGHIASVSEGGISLELPHPRAHLRGFVLCPLAEISPEWVHPILQETAESLLEAVPIEQIVELLS